MAYGQDGHVGISFQDSLGTSNVDSFDFLPIISESLTENVDDLMSEGMASRLEEPDDYDGMHSNEGDLVVEVHPMLIGKFLLGWAGQESVSVVGSSYSHSFVPLEEDWDAERCAVRPATIEVYRDTGSAYLYYDMVLNTLSFEIAQGALLRATASFIGGQFSWVAKQTPSYEPGSYFTWDTVSVSLAGSAIDEVSQLTLTFNNNLAGRAYLDLKRYHSRFLRDDYRTIEISGTMLLSGDDEARNYRNRTQQRLVITATDPSTIGLEEHNELEIDIPQMKYTNFPANLSGRGLVEVGFEAKGKYDSTSSYACQFTLVNTYDAYI